MQWGNNREPNNVEDVRGSSEDSGGGGLIGGLLSGRISEVQQNALSARLELQADCLAGVWGYHVKSQFQITQQDVQDAMNAATKIGDDALQRQATGTIRPDSFTYGTSAERVRWFNTGLQSGSIQRCDTFNTRDL